MGNRGYMKSFHEFYADEAMSMQTRMKMKRAAKKNKGKILAGYQFAGYLISLSFNFLEL